jgi:hypothetical protein
METTNGLLRKTNQIELVGIITSINRFTILLVGEVGYLRNALNSFYQEIHPDGDQIRYSIIVHPHMQLIDWIEDTISINGITLPKVD